MNPAHRSPTPTRHDSGTRIKAVPHATTSPHDDHEVALDAADGPATLAACLRMVGRAARLPGVSDDDRAALPLVWLEHEAARLDRRAHVARLLHGVG